MYKILLTMREFSAYGFTRCGVFCSIAWNIPMSLFKQEGRLSVNTNFFFISVTIPILLTTSPDIRNQKQPLLNLHFAPVAISTQSVC